MLRCSHGRRFILLALVAAIVVTVLVLWRLSWIAPAWYAPPDPKNQRIIALADTVEYRLVEEAQKIRAPESDHWTLRVEDSQINAWLSARLPKWVAHEEGLVWPAQLGTPQIRIQPEGISMALPIMQSGAARTVVARIRPEMFRGALQLQVDRVALGRVSLPGEPLTNLLERLTAAAPQLIDDPRTKSALDLLSQSRNIDPILKLEDGRHIRLIGFTLGDGRIDLSVQTLD